MTYYKSVRIINGKPVLIIVDDGGNIIKNPTKEQTSVAISEGIDSYRKYKFIQKLKGRKCCICGNNDTGKNFGGNYQWHSCECKKQNCTRYICTRCYTRLQSAEEWRKNKLYYVRGRKCHICRGDKSSGNWCKYYDKNGDWNGTSWVCSKCYAMIIRDSDWRKGNLDPLSATGKGFIGQQIVANRYGVEDCNLKMNNFRFYVDLSKIAGYGYCEVKTRSFDILQGKYEQWNFDTRREQEYDTLFALCMDRNKPWKDIERVYAIPWEVIVSRNKCNVTISRNSLKRGYWYEEFRIDEKSFNETYHNMKLENCKILYGMTEVQVDI
jgi:hypothetical protein